MRLHFHIARLTVGIRLKSRTTSRPEEQTRSHELLSAERQYQTSSLLTVVRPLDFEGSSKIPLELRGDTMRRRTRNARPTEIQGDSVFHDGQISRWALAHGS